MTATSGTRSSCTSRSRTPLSEGRVALTLLLKSSAAALAWVAVSGAIKEYSGAGLPDARLRLAHHRADRGKNHDPGRTQRVQKPRLSATQACPGGQTGTPPARAAPSLVRTPRDARGALLFATGQAWPNTAEVSFLQVDRQVGTKKRPSASGIPPFPHPHDFTSRGPTCPGHGRPARSGHDCFCPLSCARSPPSRNGRGPRNADRLS
jgi:hypothetical protein